MTAAAGARIAALLFVVAILQVSAFATVSIAHGVPDVLLVTLVAVSLVRGAVTGAVAGFAVGLVVDVAVMGTLGTTSLLLTLVGFWAGRYGETTGRDRPHAPFLAVIAATVFVAAGGWMLESVLGGALAFGTVLLALPATLAWNVLLTYPVLALVRRVVGVPERTDRAREVELLV